MIKNRYRRELAAIIDRIFRSTAGTTLVALASKASLCPRTVSRLYERETLYPRLGTVLSLADAVGLEVQLHSKIAKRQAS